MPDYLMTIEIIVPLSISFKLKPFGDVSQNSPRLPLAAALAPFGFVQKEGTWSIPEIAESSASAGLKPRNIIVLLFDELG